MSASLVGSEMCIRDSPCGGGGRALRSDQGGRGLPPDATGGHDRGGAEGPVSYTHLTLPTICSV
eukprot:5479595-Alexandrium_andersonii.AAC.1